jgi:hypothetical protein
LELGALLLAGQIIYLPMLAMLEIAPFLGDLAPAHTFEVLLLAYVMLLVKTLVSTWALLDEGNQSFALRLFHTTNLIPIGLVNALLSFRLIQLVLHEGVSLGQGFVLVMLAALVTLAAAICIGSGLARLKPGQRILTTESPAE